MLCWVVGVTLSLAVTASAQVLPTYEAPMVEGIVVDDHGRGLANGIVVVSWLENVQGDFPPPIATVEVQTNASGRFTTAPTKARLFASPTFIGVVVYVPRYRPEVLTQPIPKQPLRIELKRYDEDAQANAEAIGGAILGLGRAWAARDAGPRPAALEALRRDWERLPAESHATVLEAWNAPDDFIALFEFWAQEFRGARDRVYLERRRAR